MNRRIFLFRSAVASLAALPFVRTILRPWIVLHREGDVIGDHVFAVTPPMAGHYGMDTLVVRWPWRTVVYPLHKVTLDRAVMVYTIPQSGLSHTFTGAPTAIDSRPFGHHPHAPAIRLTSPTRGLRFRRGRGEDEDHSYWQRGKP